MSEIAPPLGSGRYRLIATLGVGGMATVYRAHDGLLDVYRAIKVLTPALSRNPRVRERFLVEARTMARLRHECVVTVHDVGVDDDRVYLVMELLDGGSLMDRVRVGGPVPPRMAVEAVLSVLRALAEAHRQGVVHRDVKPHNVLLHADGSPKLADFGIARVSETDHALTRTGQVIGTFAYMAPEQRSDPRSVDARADLYAAGATLYAILTARDPFDLFATELHERLFADFPPAVAAVVQRATRYDPNARFASADEMIAALEAALVTLPADPGDTPPLALPTPDPEVDLERPVAGSLAEATFDGAMAQSPAHVTVTATAAPPRRRAAAPPAPRRPVAAGLLLVAGLVASTLAVGLAVLLVLTPFGSPPTPAALPELPAIAPDTEPALAEVAPPAPAFAEVVPTAPVAPSAGRIAAARPEVVPEPTTEAAVVVPAVELPPEPSGVVPPPPAGQGQLCLFRPRKVVGAELKIWIYLDNVEVGGLKNGQWACAPLPPGAHRVFAATPGARETHPAVSLGGNATFELAAGQTVLARLEPVADGARTAVTITGEEAFVDSGTRPGRLR